MTIVRFEEVLNSDEKLKDVRKKVTLEDGSELAVTPDEDQVKLSIHCTWSHRIVEVVMIREHAASLKDLLAEALKGFEQES